MLLASWTKRQSGSRGWMRDVMIRKDGHNHEIWPRFMGNRTLPATRKTVKGNSVLDFLETWRCTNPSRKILHIWHHSKHDIAIPCRSCNQTRSVSTSVYFGVPLICMHPLSIYEMLNIGIVWFGLPGSRSTLWCWAWPRLPSMLAPQVVPRTPSLWFLPPPATAAPVPVDVEIRACSRSVWLATPVKPCIPSPARETPWRTLSGCSKCSLFRNDPLHAISPTKANPFYQNLDSGRFILLKADLNLSFALEKTGEQVSWYELEEDRDKVERDSEWRAHNLIPHTHRHALQTPKNGFWQGWLTQGKKSALQWE